MPIQANTTVVKQVVINGAERESVFANNVQVFASIIPAGSVTFTADDNWIVPDGVINATACMCGGGGGGAVTNKGGGGGSGSIAIPIVLFPGTNVQIFIGIGGVEGKASPAPINGFDGSQSRIVGDGGLDVVSPGGKGGTQDFGGDGINGGGKGGWKNQNGFPSSGCGGNYVGGTNTNSVNGGGGGGGGYGNGGSNNVTTPASGGGGGSAGHQNNDFPAMPGSNGKVVISWDAQ